MNDYFIELNKLYADAIPGQEKSYIFMAIYAVANKLKKIAV